MPPQVVRVNTIKGQRPFKNADLLFQHKLLYLLLHGALLVLCEPSRASPVLRVHLKPSPRNEDARTRPYRRFCTGEERAGYDTTLGRQAAPWLRCSIIVQPLEGRLVDDRSESLGERVTEEREVRSAKAAHPIPVSPSGEDN